MKKKTNTLAIVGFILSIFTFIIGFIISIMASTSIDETKEKGKGLTRAGMIISSVKIIAVIILFILFANVNTSYVGDKCKIATDCEINEAGTYTCTITNDEGVEEYIECATEVIDKNKGNKTDNEQTPDSESDTTDYDKEF